MLLPQVNMGFEDAEEEAVQERATCQF